jgi:hypothetical protein
MPAWKESNQSGMRYVGAFYFPSAAHHRPMQTAAYLCELGCIGRGYILGAGWMEKKRWSASRVHAVTSDLGYPGRSAHYERLGRLYFVTSQERLLFISH